MNSSRALRALSFSAIAALTTLAISSSASAQETVRTGRGVGVGYAAMLSGANGLSGSYDGGRWHADVLVGLSNNGTSSLELGVRGWFHLHSAAAADFSVGGGLGIINTNPPGPGDSQIVGIDVGLLIRAFVTSNVALSAFGGLGIQTGDSDLVALNAQPVGLLGLTYYFH
jgi:hypothetical protein